VKQYKKIFIGNFWQKNLFKKTCANQLEQRIIYLVGFSKEKQQKAFPPTIEKRIRQTILR